MLSFGDIRYCRDRNLVGWPPDVDRRARPIVRTGAYRAGALTEAVLWLSTLRIFDTPPLSMSLVLSASGVSPPSYLAGEMRRLMR